MVRRRLVAVVLAILLTCPVAVGVGLGAENVRDGSATPETADETAKVKHTFGYRVDDVSNDGNQDRLFVTFPEGVSSEDLSSFSGNVTDAETGASVSISSSPTVVDGPDGDGVQDTVKIGVQSEGERATRDLIVNVTGYVTWPAVESDADLPVKASVTDSGGADVSLVTFATVTVADTGDGDASGTATPTATATETPTATSSDSTDGTATDAQSDDGSDSGDASADGSPGTSTPAGSDTPASATTATATDEPSTATSTPTGAGTETEGDGPGFGAFVGLVALSLSVALYRRRR